MRHLAAAVLPFAAAAVLLDASAARAAPCPAVMIVLDTSGSMNMAPDGSSATPSKMDLAKQAIGTLLGKYGDQLPFGYTTFSSNPLVGCTSGITTLVEPMHGTKANVVAKVNATVAAGGTNTGEAIDKVASDPAMNDTMRPGAYIILITDGAPNCNAGDQGPATYTTGRIAAAAAKGIKTFVIGYGALAAQESMNMDDMAAAGGEPCSGASCSGGHKYYVADNGAALSMLLDSIANQIGSGEFNSAACDDTCYSNSCPSGQICVGAMCKPDPCATVSCPSGQYCLTNGSSSGSCVAPCAQSCPSGQQCVSGQCVTDLCASMSCPTGQACAAGQCKMDQCGSGCASGLVCYQGQCVDDPCRYVHCPTGAGCISGSGACVIGGGIATPGGPPHNRGGGGGCSVGRSPLAGTFALSILGALGLMLMRRRTQRTGGR